MPTNRSARALVANKTFENVLTFIMNNIMVRTTPLKNILNKIKIIFNGIKPIKLFCGIGSVIFCDELMNIFKSKE
jgi:hypothetical protein